MEVVTVAVAVAGTVTDAGLTVHVGATVAPPDGLAVQPSVTAVPVIPFPIVIAEEAVPPGGTASGENDPACSVKSCATAAEGSMPVNASAAASKQRAPITRTAAADLNLDSHHSDLNMNEFWFKYLRFPGAPKRCPRERTAEVSQISSQTRHTTASGAQQGRCTFNLNPNTTIKAAGFSYEGPPKTQRPPDTKGGHGSALIYFQGKCRRVTRCAGSAGHGDVVGARRRAATASTAAPTASTTRTSATGWQHQQSSSKDREHHESE